MAAPTSLSAFLKSAEVAPEVYQLRPDYRALLIAVEGISPAASNAASEAILQDAENQVKAKLATQAVTDFPHVAAWREAYKSFGAKPAKYRNSLEALTRRVATRLPRVNRLTDIYNAISIKHQLPLGGEDLDKYEGAARLLRATGQEKFEVKAGADISTEHPDKGEVVWCDDGGVTCRRWNWRQGPRTALTDDTRRAFFILDALDIVPDEAMQIAGDELIMHLKQLGPDVKIEQRILRKPDA